MAANPRFVSDLISIMRVAIGRRNANDPDSSDENLLSYINDFVSFTMTNDVKVFEQFGTLTFTIDATTTTDSNVINGAVNFSTISDGDFSNLSSEAFITLLDPQYNSVSWNRLPIYQDPGEFYSIWGVNNEEILIAGYPTMMLYYGGELVFRTIPNDTYQVRIYGYRQNSDYSDEEDEQLQHNYWVRYLAYGAALNYAMDYRFDPQTIAGIKSGQMRERKFLLTHAHNQIKQSRCMPRF
jgi:hypothetical protein